MAPFVGVSISPKRFRRVVFPLPDGPNNIENSPLIISRLIYGIAEIIVFA